MEEIEQGRIYDEITEIDLRELIDLLWRKKWIIIGLFVLAVIASYFLSQQMTEIYQTSTLVMVNENSGNMGDIFGEEYSFIGGKSNKISTYSQILKSRRILTKVITELNLRNEETDELISANSLKGNITINNTDSSDLINITVNYHDPLKAKQIANLIVSIFKEENQEMNRADLKGARDFIATQLKKTENNLSQLEDKLLSYKEDHGVILPEEQGKTLIDRLVKMETGKVEAELQLEKAQAGLNKIEERMKEEDEEIITAKVISDNPVVINAEKKLSELQIEFAGLKELYTDKHPVLIELKKKITEVEKQLATVVKEMISSRTESYNPVYRSLEEKIIDYQILLLTSNVQVNTYKELISEVEDKLNKLPQKELDLARLQREKKVAEEIYIMLMNRREEIQIQEAMQSSDIIVIDPAIVRGKPIKPNIKLNMAIAGILAILIAIGIIFVLEYIDTTVKNEDDIKRLTGLPVLGVIPKMDEVDHNAGYGKGEN